MKTVAAQIAAEIGVYFPALRDVVRVSGYHTGDFLGEVERVDRDVVALLITDPLRPYQKKGCPFPQCIAEADHDGAHVFPTLCAGHRIEVPWRLAKFETVEVAA